MDHGCGAHSQTDVPQLTTDWPAPPSAGDDLELVPHEAVVEVEAVAEVEAPADESPADEAPADESPADEAPAENADLPAQVPAPE